MSAFGTKRTSPHVQPMSAFGGKADIDPALTLGGRSYQSRWHRDTPTISVCELFSHCSRQCRADSGKISGWLLGKNHGCAHCPLRVDFEKIVRCIEVPYTVDGHHVDI